MSGRARSSARSLALVKSARSRLLCCGRHTVNLVRYNLTFLACQGSRRRASDGQLLQCIGCSAAPVLRRRSAQQSLGSAYLLRWVSAAHTHTEEPSSRTSSVCTSVLLIKLVWFSGQTQAPHMPWLFVSCLQSLDAALPSGCTMRLTRSGTALR